MTSIEIHALSYWRASQAMRNPRQSPADRAQLCDTLGMIAATAPGRIAQAAADRLARETAPFVEDDTLDFGPEAS